ncbi:MAG: DUF2332 domain-containing protein [Candidatus Andeanibacterium colombiense]|uniref:DUF2332 domain-containing protein n=1 Tax=Candidatus Andeanibacterium colombiense TaxID=3121345 RepID=A0AAJ5XAH1_9SPHN|nr:MAG: DUF2332 domain-containing protein [Sphingomonadaceae bacterium]
MADETGKTGVMAIPEVDAAIQWQADHADRAGAPCTGRIVRAERAIMKTETDVGRRIRGWEGLTLEAAMPLRIAGGIHHLFLTGDAPELAPVYAGELTDQEAVDAIVVGLVERFDARLSPWLDGPPQTNEAGRSASIMAGLLWLSQRPGPKFELYEIGASAGVNTMMERYFYDLGGVRVGPEDSPMTIAPEWRGSPPPEGEIEIVSIRGSDIAPVDLSDPAQALRLKAYVWADAKERMQRIDAAIRLAGEQRPDLVRQDAGEFVAELVKRPQAEGVTRVLYHSVMWQYLPPATRDAITAAMERAGEGATAERPLAWVRLETNRQTFAHELTVKYWPGGGAGWTQLTQAHPHGAWVEWVG